MKLVITANRITACVRPTVYKAETNPDMRTVEVYCTIGNYFGVL